MSACPGPEIDEARVRRALAQTGTQSDPLPRVEWFGDSPELANQLATLVAAGRKRATAGLLWRFQADHEPVPQPGDRQVIIDWDGEPRAVIEMTRIDVVPFDQVDAGFARAEGEGDLSLDYWRQVHQEFFERECARLGRRAESNMPVVCMRFRLLERLTGQVTSGG
jgi:uncharacterized protein YhfF